MPEELTDVGRGITICHESFGSADDEPLLLVMGLGTQMVGWHEDFCRALAGRGFHVTRFDNRDTGRSTHLDFPPPTLRQLTARRFRPEQYTLEDMAADTAGLIEALDLGPVHLAGMSMGGMIAQTLAATRPELVRSLASISSNTGGRLNGQPGFGIMRALLKRAPTEREAFIEHVAELFGLIGTPGADRDEIRELAAMHYERGRDPRGSDRQLAAILKTGSRAKLLRRIGAPTVVIHGTRDKLVRPSGGRATARLIPRARHIQLDGVGHDLPRAEWPRIIGAIAENAARGRAGGDRGAVGAAA